VRFLGFVNQTQLPALYTAADVMVLPSLWEEPSPMTIGESFAYARPVIGSRRGGIPELVNDQRAGWLFEPGKGDLFALLAEISSNGHGVMEKSRFLSSQTGRRSFDDLVSEYLAVYRDVGKASNVFK